MNDRFTAANKTKLQAGIVISSIPQIARDATLVAYDHMRLAEILLKIVLGDTSYAHDIGNISYVGYLIAQEEDSLRARPASQPATTTSPEEVA